MVLQHDIKLMASLPALRAIDRLIAATRLDPIRKVVAMSDGTEFEFWHTPLVAAERERINKDAKGDNNDFAMQLLVQKAVDENGERLFSAGDIGTLKRRLRDEDLQRLELAVIQNEDSDYYSPKA
jgi:hypothetical protein